MADVKWIKIATNVFDNRKIRQIECLPDGDGMIVIWFKLLCLAGNINDGGMVYFTKDIPYTEQMLATEFNRPLTLVQMALRTFCNFGMIEIVENLLQISNWEKYQNVEKLEELREYNRIAQQRSREKRKALQTVNDTSMTCQPCQGTDIEGDKELEIDTSSKKSAPSKSKIIKHSHGEYGWVKLSEAEYNRLLNELGQEELDRCIRYVDESAQGNRNKNKWSDWNLVVRRCHREGWGPRGKAVIRNEPRNHQFDGEGFRETI